MPRAELNRDIGTPNVKRQYHFTRLQACSSLPGVHAWEWGREPGSRPPAGWYRALFLAVEPKESTLNMPHNPKIAFYRERFNLALVDFDQDVAARQLPEAPQNEHRMTAIRNAIADLRGDLAQLDQIIRVLEWLTANPSAEKT